MKVSRGFLKKCEMLLIAATVLWAFVLAAVGNFTLVERRANSERLRDSIDLDEDYYYEACEVKVSRGQAVTISYTVRVAEGPPIDVFFMDYDRYVDWQCDPKSRIDIKGIMKEYPSMNALSVKYDSGSVTLKEPGIYYLLFDNTDVGTEPPWDLKNDVARIDFTIETSVRSAIEVNAIAVAACLVILTAVVIVIVELSDDEKAGEEGLEEGQSNTTAREPSTPAPAPAVNKQAPSVDSNGEGDETCFRRTG